MVLESSLANIFIKNNIIDKGRTSSGTHTYTAHGWIYGSAVVSENTFLSPSASEDMLNIDNCSCIVSKNKFVRSSTSINSYIRNYGSNDQIITDNIFDGYTTNGSNEDIVTGLSVTSTYERNKNQTIYVPVTLVDKLSNKVGFGTGGAGLSSLLSTPTTPPNTNVVVAKDSNNFINIGVAGTTTSYIASFNVNVNSVIPENVQVLEYKIGIRGAPITATLATNDVAVGLWFQSHVDETLSANYAAGTGSILDVSRRGSNSAQVTTFYDTVTNYTAVTTNNQYVTLTPTPSNYWINNRNNAIILWVMMATRLTAGSINWLMSPVVIKCRWV